jgi:hypothetical protein
LILRPINHVLSHPTLTLSARRPEAHTAPVPARLFRKKIDNLENCQFSLVEVLSSASSTVTSNLSFTSSSSLFFGLSSGDLCGFHDSELCGHSVGRASICHLCHFYNYGFPVTFCATRDGYLTAVHPIEGFSGVTFLNGFRVCDSSFFCECASSRLFAIPNGSSSLSIFDLTEERRVCELFPQFGRPKTIRIASDLSDVVAVCSDRLEFFDLRDITSPVLSFEGPTFDVFDLGTDAFHFGLCRSNPAVSIVDVRKGVIETISVGEVGTETRSFAGQVEGSIVTVGTDRGISVFDAERSGSKVEIGEIGGRTFGPVLQCAVDPLRLRVALLLENGDIVGAVGDL